MLDGSYKGLPPDLPPTPIDAIGSLGWSLPGDELPGPVAVLRVGALAHNRAWMRAFCVRAGVDLAPHAKTTMSPQLFELQRQDGVWGLTVATVHQAKVALDAGFRRLILANEVVGAPEIAWVERANRGAEVLVLVDSLEGVRRLLGRGVPVLVEVGYPGGRGGCRTVEEAVAVARAAHETRGVRLAGIEAFEGLIQGGMPEEREARVDAFLDRVAEVAERCAGWFGEEALLTAGGSMFHDRVVARFARLSERFRVVLRSGCYLTGDHGLYGAAFARLGERDPALAGGIRPALEVWATVLSCPEPGRVILGAGKRDVGIDAGFPVPIRRARGAEIAAVTGRIVEVNDQHAHIAPGEGDDLRVGDRVALGITHPCTTFDRWSVLLLVDEGWNVVGAVRTYFG